MIVVMELFTFIDLCENYIKKSLAGRLSGLSKMLTIFEIFSLTHLAVKLISYLNEYRTRAINRCSRLVAAP